MSSRRSFIKTLGVAGAGAVLPKFSASGKAIPPIPADGNDEKFWSLVRENFHLAPGYVYLNNGTMGPSPASVEQFLIHEIQEVNTRLNYGGGDVGRDKIAELISAKSGEISLTHNTTEGINIVANGLRLKKGDEVLMTHFEHVGNAMPWLNRAHRDGIVVRTMDSPLRKDDFMNLLNDRISKKTKVIAVPHVNCTIGQRLPVAEIISLARDKGLKCMIDGAHGPGALALNMQELKPDFYAACCHKWMLGPKGTGFVYIKEELIEEMTPGYAGAYSDKGFDITVDPAQFDGYNPTAHRFDYGTQNAALQRTIGKTVEFLMQIGMEKIEERILSLNEYLYRQLSSLDMVQMLSSEEVASRSMMLGFRHKKLDMRAFSAACSEQDMRIRIVPESGLNSIRISTHIYNSFEQLDKFIELVKKAG